MEQNCLPSYAISSVTAELPPSVAIRGMDLALLEERPSNLPLLADRPPKLIDHQYTAPTGRATIIIVTLAG